MWFEHAAFNSSVLEKWGIESNTCPRGLRYFCECCLFLSQSTAVSMPELIVELLSVANDTSP